MRTVSSGHHKAKLGWKLLAGLPKKKRARLRGDATEEAFARLAFQLCMQQTQETDAH